MDNHKQFYMTEPSYDPGSIMGFFRVYLSPKLYETPERAKGEVKIEGINSIFNVHQPYEFDCFTNRLYDAEEVWLRLSYKLDQRVTLIQSWNKALEKHAPAEYQESSSE